MIVLHVCLLEHSDPRTTKDIRASIFEEDYSYLTNKVEDIREEELLDLSYYARRASVVSAFGISRQEEVFMLDLLRKEIRRFKDVPNPSPLNEYGIYRILKGFLPRSQICKLLWTLLLTPSTLIDKVKSFVQ